MPSYKSIFQVPSCIKPCPLSNHHISSFQISTPPPLHPLHKIQYHIPISHHPNFHNLVIDPLIPSACIYHAHCPYHTLKEMTKLRLKKKRESADKRSRKKTKEKRPTPCWYPDRTNTSAVVVHGSPGIHGIQGVQALPWFRSFLNHYPNTSSTPPSQLPLHSHS
jgi:hypothetical protein